MAVILFHRPEAWSRQQHHLREPKSQSRAVLAVLAVLAQPACKFPIALALLLQQI